MPSRGDEFPRALLNAIAEADMVIHLGDFNTLEVVSTLERLCTLYAVHGNVDEVEVQAVLPLKRHLKVEGHSLVLLHGHTGGPTARAAAARVSDVDVVLFGHSHMPYNAFESGRLLFNPGSAMDRRRAPTCSYGVLRVGEQIDARIIPLP
jgi:putative phosphoesterase